MSLSPEQHAAVTSPAARTVIQAGAGAGKTRVLVARYLTLVREGLSPDHILTVTYTSKAASEMKRRIVDALREEGFSDEAQVAETGSIQTLHSFCDRILRECALEAGVDPDFELLPETDRKAWQSDALARSLEGASGDPLVQGLVETLAGERHQQYNTPAGNRLNVRLEELVGEVMKRWREAGWEPDTAWRTFGDPERLLHHQALAIAKLEGLTAPPDPPADDLRAWLVATFTDRKWVTQLPKVNDERPAATLLAGLVRLTVAVWQRLEARMDAEQRFDFLRMERRAVRLLETSEAAQARVRRRFRAILVDEAQDLNPVQYRLLNALDAPNELVVGDPQQSIYRFRLAQRDQFIERGGAGELHHLRVNHRSSPGILNFVESVFTAAWHDGYSVMVPPPQEAKEESFPSPVASLETEPVEDPFAIATEEPREFDGVEWWVTGDQGREADVVEGIAQLLAEGVTPGDIAVLARKGKELQGLGKAMANRGIPYRMVKGSEQFFVRLEVRDLANALSALTDPQDDLALLAVLRSPAVGLSLDAIVELGLAAPVGPALTEYTSSVPEDAARLEEFRGWWFDLAAQAGRLAAWEVLQHFVGRSHYLERIARRPYGLPAVANVRKLLELAASEPDASPREFAVRLRSLSQLQHSEPDASPFDAEANLVSLLTIHSAKGLEWPVVVLAGLDQTLRATRAAPSVLFHAESGLLGARLGTDAPSLVHHYLAQREQHLDTEEEQRVLYVALTRPERRLCLPMRPTKGDNFFRGMFHPVLKKPDDAARRGVRVRLVRPPTPPVDGWRDGDS